MGQDEAADQSAGSYSLLALRLERDLAREGQGVSIMVVATDDDSVGVESTVELAWCLAQDLGRSVLIIDGAFNSGGLGSALGLADNGGLAQLLDAPAIDCATLTHRVQRTRHERIAVLTHAGDPRATVRAEAVRSLLAAACEHYDFVLVHGSLLAEGGRSMAFGSLVDATVLLAMEGQSTIDDVARGQRLLNDCGARRVALVLGSRPRARRTKRRWL